MCMRREISEGRTGARFIQMEYDSGKRWGYLDYMTDAEAQEVVNQVSRLPWHQRKLALAIWSHFGNSPNRRTRDQFGVFGLM